MKTKFTLFILALFSCSVTELSAQCSGVVDSDTYSSASGWTAVGAGFVGVSGGACTFQGAADGVYDRVYRPLAATLSDTYFKAEFKFTIAATPAGNGVGTNLMSLCAGSLDPISYDNSQSYAATNQDGLIVMLSSPTTTDNNVNNWDLMLGYHDGATYTTAANNISLTSSILTYYVVFERTSLTSTTLSAYSDAGHTMLVGQAVNSISSSITGLNYLHHGVTTWGWNTREFTGYVDDFTVCDNGQIAATCTRVVDTDNFSSANGWSAVGAGFVAVSGGACTFQGAADGVYDRVYRPLASTVSDTYFKAEFKFTIAATPAGHGVGTNLIALSAGSLDPISYDNSQSYATTNQDGLIVLLNSPTTTDNNVNNWYLSVGSKDGTTFVNTTNTVSLNSSTLTYYVVLERTSSSSTTLSAYSDLAHTVLVGQATNAIPSTITGLNYLHHGVTTFGWNTREFTGYVDDVTICDDLVDGIETNNQLSGIHVFPNPSANGQVTIDLGNSGAEMLFVYNALGELVSQTKLNSNSKMIELDLSSGVYFIQLAVGEKRVSFKQVVQ